MKPIWLIVPLLLSACVSRSNLPPNPNAVPAVQQAITAARTGTDYIYVTGGIFDGAAAGQTATFVVTPDDAVLCTFQSDPVLEGDGPLTTVTGHRLQVAGSYGALSAILLPNVTVQETEFTTNFTVETGSPLGPVSTQTGFGDPRFDAMLAYFISNPTPCWSFG